MNRYHTAIYTSTEKLNFLKVNSAKVYNESLIQYSRRHNRIWLYRARGEGKSYAKVTTRSDERERENKNETVGRIYLAPPLRDVRKCARIIACTGCHFEAEESARVSERLDKRGLKGGDRGHFPPCMFNEPTATTAAECFLKSSSSANEANLT